MKPDTKQFLDLLFNEGETVCVSNNKYGHHSIALEDLGSNSVELLSPNGRLNTISPQEILLIALNPISGYRTDANCTSLRTFLVELDGEEIPEQMQYIKRLDMPFTACVFSGSKSLHFAITLNEDLTHIDQYRFFAEWILNIVSLADQATKNPSRSIRYPGNLRDGVEQKLIQLNKRITKDDLIHWLSRWPELKPQLRDKIDNGIPSFKDARLIPPWLAKELAEGIDFSNGRNNKWFKIAISVMKAGFDYDDTVSYLEPYFEESYDFKRSEWLGTIKSAFSKIKRG